MPSLSDLPPELINQIHLEHEQLVLAELSGQQRQQQRHGSCAVAVNFGALRLANRFIERATRRSFLLEHFDVWQIQAPNDADIQKFCMMAKTADLAASVRQLHLRVDDDDYSKCVQGTVGAASESEVEATHVFDDVSGALVPAAYFRNREALLEAFRACVNVVELWFVNRLLDDRPTKRYRLEWRGIEQMTGAGENDDFDYDEDESESEHSDENGTEDVDEDKGEGEMEDDDEAKEEDESKDGAHVNSDADQEDESDGNED
jgi:hypothetical protein